MEITCTQNIYISSNGSSRITYYILQPENTQIKGIIQIAHDICEYFSRYTHFAKYLCGLGYIVCGNDHLGHGNSASKASDLGYFSRRDGYRNLVDDLYLLTDIMQKRYPYLPYFLLGQGMGALMAQLYLPRYGQKLTGCIFCGLPVSQPTSSMNIKISNSVVHTKGPYYRSAMLNRLACGNYLKKIKDSRTPFDWLTHDQKIIDIYQSDEKCNFIVTASGFRDYFRLLVTASSLKTYRSAPHALPLLFLSGDMDPAGNYGIGVRQVAAYYKNSGQKQIELVLYKEGRHEILNETNRLEVYGDILRWIEGVLEQPQTESSAKEHSRFQN
jgi:alpha-beta hydrolase superfamily lysophospholipase